MEKKPKLSTVILTRNEEKNIAGCIASVQWADEVVVFDSFSQDRTVEIARESGATVFSTLFRTSPSSATPPWMPWIPTGSSSLMPTSEPHRS